MSPLAEPTLPIHAVLPRLLATLRDRPNAVLVAPPGAGKTTAVAPALLDEPWCSGEILLLSPRRIAARAAAERMAELRGERVGDTIGYATRLDSKRSAKTRILVVTEGIFRNRIQADPELAGVSAVHGTDNLRLVHKPDKALDVAPLDVGRPDIIGDELR